MFGLEFLFGAALYALPLASLPVILHLLFRRKSPVVLFSTLRFIRSALQHTAARKKVQRWLLLALRVLLLSLLIWAVAQPARRTSDAWLSSGDSAVVAIVVDTSYSMALKDPQHQETLLQRADGVVRDLLGGPLANANVVILRSKPAPPGEPERMRPAGEVLKELAPFQPQPSPVPLGDRVAGAVRLLQGQKLTDRWLVIISDMQRREFNHPLPDLPDARVLVIDLHPDDARAAGVTNLEVTPKQPVPGSPCNVTVTVAGRSADSALNLHVAKLDGTDLATHGPRMPQLGGDGAGVGAASAQVNFAVPLPPEPWMQLVGELERGDALEWARRRSVVIAMPPRQRAVVFDAPTMPQAQRVVRLALDPFEGTNKFWPVEVRRGSDLDALRDEAAVVLLAQWQEAADAERLRDFARKGGRVILFLQPGLEESWSKLPEAQRDAIGELLPAEPLSVPVAARAYVASTAMADPDPLLAGLVDPRYRLVEMVAKRVVPMSHLTAQATMPILSVSPKAGKPEEKRAGGAAAATRASGGSDAAAGEPGRGGYGLLYRRTVGSGTVFTWTTIPDLRYGNIAIQPLFTPLLVQMCLRPASHLPSYNLELGETLVLNADEYPGLEGVKGLEIQTPNREINRVPAIESGGRRRFEFAGATDPGIYTWRKPGDDTALTYANVQLPAAEAELEYVDPKQVVTVGENAIVAHSYAEFVSSVKTLTAPVPKWRGPLAIVLLLLCIEALMGSLTQLWKPNSLKSIITGGPVIEAA